MNKNINQKINYNKINKKEINLLIVNANIHKFIEVKNEPTKILKKLKNLIENSKYKYIDFFIFGFQETLDTKN